MHDSIIAPLGNLLHNAPSLILLGCAALFIVFFVYSGRIWLASRRVRQGLRSLTVTLDGLSGNEDGEHKDGLSLGRRDAYVVAFESLKGLPRQWWARIAERIDLYRSPEDREGWFLT